MKSTKGIKKIVLYHESSRELLSPRGRLRALVVKDTIRLKEKPKVNIISKEAWPPREAGELK